MDEGTNIPRGRNKCERLIEKLKYDSKYLEDAIQQLKKCKQNWITLTSKLSGTREVSEEQLYEKYAKKKKISNFLTVLDRAKILLDITDERPEMN